MSAIVKLSDIVEAVEAADETSRAYLDRQSGRIVVVTEDDIAAAEDDDAEESAPDWQKESIALAREIEADDGARFLALPDKFDAHEWGMMEEFARSVAGAASGELLDAIHGRGAFRMFKGAVDRLGLREQWFAFRGGCYRRLAAEWCEENGVKHADAG